MSSGIDFVTNDVYTGSMLLMATDTSKSTSVASVVALVLALVVAFATLAYVSPSSSGAGNAFDLVDAKDQSRDVVLPRVDVEKRPRAAGSAGQDDDTPDHSVRDDRFGHATKRDDRPLPFRGCVPAVCSSGNNSKPRAPPAAV